MTYLPPVGWFTKPLDLSDNKQLTVTNVGRVCGRAWRHDDELGTQQHSVRPPLERDGFPQFLVGRVACVEDDAVKSAQAGVVHLGEPAPLRLSAEQAQRHYEQNSTVVANVTLGVDEHGVWFSGALRHGVEPETLRSRDVLIPDWRRVGDRLRLVALVVRVDSPTYAQAKTGTLHVPAALSTVRLDDDAVEQELLDAMTKPLNEVHNDDCLCFSTLFHAWGYAGPSLTCAQRTAALRRSRGA